MIFLRSNLFLTKAYSVYFGSVPLFRVDIEKNERNPSYAVTLHTWLISSISPTCAFRLYCRQIHQKSAFFLSRTDKLLFTRHVGVGEWLLRHNFWASVPIQMPTMRYG